MGRPFPLKLPILSALCPPAPLKSLTFWRYTNQIIIIIIIFYYYYHGDLEPHLTRFLGPIRAHNHSPNGISIGSAVFAQPRDAVFTIGRPFPPRN